MERLLNKRQRNPKQRTNKTTKRSRRIRHTPRITASYSLRSMTYTCVIVHIHRWHYYIPRVKLTMIEGCHRIEEEIGKALHEARHGKKSPILAEDYPKHFTLVCRPWDLLHLANALTRICEPEEWSHRLEWPPSQLAPNAAKVGKCKSDLWED